MKPIISICQVCGKEYVSKNPFYAKTGVTKFCSYACSGKSKTRDPVARFWSKVEKTATCWLWKGRLDAWGYGHFDVDMKSGEMRAHRYSYILHFGEIPKGLLVCHHCDTPACQNPAHFFLGTDADNSRDKINKGRGIKGKKRNPEIVQRRKRGTGVARGTDVSTCKLTESQVREIRNLYGTKSIRVIGKMFNVNGNTIRAIGIRRSWAHIV